MYREAYTLQIFRTKILQKLKLPKTNAKNCASRHWVEYCRNDDAGNIVQIPQKSLSQLSHTSNTARIMTAAT